MTWREVPREMVLHGSRLRPRNKEAQEFYPPRQMTQHPTIMIKFLGLWDTTDFRFMYYCIRATTLARFVPIKTQYIQFTTRLDFL